jgi:hypothetical protein
MWVRDGCQSVVNRGNHGERVLIPTTTGIAFPAASPNSPGLDWKKALVRLGAWTRDAVVFLAVRLGGWRLSELLKPA